MFAIPAGCDLELRPLSAEDADALFSTIERNLDRLRQWLEWAAADYSLDDVQRFIGEKQAGNLAGTGLAAGIWLAGSLCGAIELHRIDGRHRSSSIGYWIDGACEGRGIATRACRAIVAEGFRSYGLHRIEIRCATANHRSAAVPQRLGFKLDGTLREAERLHDRWIDLHVFGMLQHEWPG